MTCCMLCVCRLVLVVQEQYEQENDRKYRMAVFLCLSTVYRYIHATLQLGNNWNIHILYASVQYLVTYTVICNSAIYE